MVNQFGRMTEEYRIIYDFIPNEINHALTYHVGWWSIDHLHYVYEREPPAEYIEKQNAPYIVNL